MYKRSEVRRLSVIIPGYNTPHEMWRRAVTSVLNAIAPCDEIVCIDDGSTRVPMPSFDDPRVREIRLEKNVGQAAARNIGIDHAEGEWITFVDSDDEAMPNVYSMCLAQVKSADVIMFGVKTRWMDLKVAQECIPHELCEEMPLTPSHVEELMHACLFEYVWNKIYRKGFLVEKGIRFLDGVCPGEDTLFNLDLVIANARWMQIPIVGYVYYRFDGTSLSSYSPRLVTSLRVRRERWSAYKNLVPGSSDVLGSRGEWSEREIAWRQWTNVWMRNSPYGLVDRAKWLRNEADALGIRGVGGLIKVFVMQALKVIARRYLYFKPLRRRHVIRTLQAWNPKGVFVKER